MAISLVQSKGNSGNSGTSLSVTGLTATVSGNLLVALVSADNNPGDVTFTPPTGWSQAGSTIHDDVFISVSTAVYYYKNNPGGLTSATFTSSAAVAAWHLYILEFSGIDTSSPFDGTTGREQGGTLAPTSGAITTTANGDLIVGWSELDEVSGGGDCTITQPSGYTALTRLNDGGGWNSSFPGWTTQTTAGSINYAPTKSRSDTEGVFTIVAFKAATGGGGSNFNQAVVDTQSATDSRFSQAKKPELDTQSGVDSSVENPTKMAADVTSGTDFTGKTATKPTTDAQSGVDSSTRAAQKVVGDNQSAIDSLSHLWSAHLLMVEALSGLDAVQKAVLAPILDHFSETDSVTESNQLLSGQNWSKTLTDSFSETDLIASWTLMKLLGDAYASTDSRFSQVGRPLYDVSSGNDSLTKTTLALLSDAGALTDVEVKQIRAALLDVTSAVDKMTAGKVLLLTLLDQASLLDTPMETYTKAQWGLLGLITSLVASSLGMTITFTNSTALAASTTLLAGALAMVFSIPF